MIPVKGYTTFHPLKHCIVGSVHAPDSVSDDLKDIISKARSNMKVHKKLKFAPDCVVILNLFAVAS